MHRPAAILALALAVSIAAAQTPPATSSRPASPPATAPTSPPVDAAVRDLTKYLDRAAKLKTDDIEGRLTLARWARDKKMWEQAQEMASQTLFRDPGNRAAYLILQQVDDARPL